MTNRILTSIAFLLLTQWVIAQSCLPNGIAILSQEQIDNFATDNPGCEEVMGNVYILGSSSGAITDLDGLSALTTIQGNLFIQATDQLTDLSGLENITTVNGYIDIADNQALEDISALNNLSSLGSVFQVANNGVLTEITGFNQLDNFVGDFQVFGNESLQLIDGFDNVATLNRFYIYDNNALTSLNGFSSLTNIADYININQNPELINITFGQQLTTIGSYLNISKNNSLSNLSSFNALDIIGGRFTVKENNDITTLENLQSLSVIGGDLEIEANPNLTQLWPNGINSVGGDVTLSNNTFLIDISGLLGITHINGTLELRDNDNLTDLTGLNNLTAVTNLGLSGNDDLADLSPLSSLDSVHYTFTIERQPMIQNFQDLSSISSIERLFIGTPVAWSSGLQDFTGLEAITHLDHLFVIQNTSLTSFNGLQNLAYLGDFTSFSNNEITDFSQFENLTYLGALSVYNCDGLTSCNGFSNIDTIPATVEFRLNDQLTSFSGLDNLMSVSNLRINGNDQLTSLAGLDNLTTVTGYLIIEKNDLLTDITPLANVDLMTTTDSLVIEENVALSVCGQENICNYILTGGPASVFGNAPGCNSINDVVQSCFEFQDHTSFVGQIITDINMNCLEDADENGLPNSLVNVQNDQYNYTVSADSNGYYDIPVLAGEYTLSVISPSVFWTPCFVDTLLEATATNDSMQTNFLMVPQGDCPFLDWNLTLPPLRICGSRTVVLDYCNLGALPAEDAVFALDFDEYITLDSASAPYTIDSDGIIFFDLETLDLFDCGSITMSVFLDCDSVEIDEVLCVNVELISDELCTPNGLWDESNITASGYCENDSIYFELKNIGSGDMSQDAQFRVDILIEDIVLLHDADNYLLPTGDSIVLSYELDGDGFRIEADQTPGHPIYTEATAVVPNCTEAINDLILTLFPTNNGDPFSETFCTFALNSFDPNIKTATPRGVGENHEIDKDWELDYTIQFQNTGNDVAYLVTIRDTLSENVDLSTLKVHGATHDFTWALNQDRELVFTFEDINLPDSTSNEPESHGHVSYSISPQKDILPGEEIRNRAAIYFDFNEPIITNTVLRTIKKPVIVNTGDVEICYGEVLLENTITNDTTVQELTEFVTYDSIQLFHVNALPLSYNNAFAEVVIGDTYEGIVINADTSFVVTYAAQNGCDSLVTYDISALTSIFELNPFYNVRLYPNPVSELLHVESYPMEFSQNWTLVNTIGNIVWTQKLESYEQLTNIPMDHLPKGIYILQVNTDERKAIWKVVKE